jgi:preprotein translocase subunit SecF
MTIVKYRKIFYGVSIVLILISLFSIFKWGLNWGIDFRGGSIIEIDYKSDRPSVEQVKESLKNLNLGETVRTIGDKGYIITAKHIDQEEKNELDAKLKIDGTKTFTENRFSTIGPVMGSEAKRKAVVSIIVVILAIVIFITYAFRKVSKPVSSWKYGTIAIVALIHDVVIPVGAFAIFGHYLGYEVDTLFVTALLVVLGFSIHDTIVVFDRVRENLRRNHEEGLKKDFATIVGDSIKQTFVRSINTSLTTVLSLIALYIWGPEITRHFSLALIIGIVSGTYSSIFLGSPLLVTVEQWQSKKANKVS